MKQTQYMMGGTLVALIALGALCGAGCSNSGPQRVLSGDGVEVRGSGVVVTESRSVSGVRGVELASIGTVYVEQGGAESLVIEAEDNLIPLLRTEVQGGVLVISTEEGYNLQATRPMEFRLTVNTLERAELAGVGDILASGLSVGDLALDLNGVGNIELLGVDATRLDVVNSGVGDVSVSGSVPQQSVRLLSSGDYLAGDLVSGVADVLVASNGSATVRVSDHLTATIDSSGSVYYIGNPVVVQNVSGSGSVVQIGG